MGTAMGTIIAVLRWLLAAFFALLAIGGLFVFPLGGLLIAAAAFMASPPGGKALASRIAMFGKQRTQMLLACALFFAGAIAGAFVGGKSSSPGFSPDQQATAPKLSAATLTSRFQQRMAEGDASAALVVGSTLVRTWPRSAEAAAVRPRLAELQAKVAADRNAAAARKQEAARAAIVKNAEKEAAARKKFASEVASLRRERDDIEGITFYYDRNVPMNAVANYFGLYLGVPDKGEPYLRWKFMYTGDDWLFIEAMKFNIDGTMVGPMQFPYGAIERDNSAGQVWEWRDEPVSSAEEIAPFLKIASSKTTLLRLEGRQYRKDREITSREKAAILKILDVYASMKRWGRPQ